MSTFEDFIKKNREHLDANDTPEMAWQNIEDQLDHKPNRWKGFQHLKIAATLLLCFAMGFAISQFISKGESTQEASIDLSVYSEELAFIDQKYSPVIMQTVGELTSRPEFATDTAHFSVFIDQFNFLEKQNEDYLKELKRNGYKENIVEELIKNYSYKLELLKKLQIEIHKYNHQLKTIGYEKQPNYIAI